MTGIPHEEWLEQAKALPVGRSNRVYHAGERRPNLIVFNNEDNWSCWCHSCHTGGFVPKQHVRLSTGQKQRARGAVLPSDGKPLEELSAADTRRVAKHLASKGMDVKHLVGTDPTYSPSEDRLLLRCTGGVIGRALHETYVKWCCYRNGLGGTASFAEHPSTNYSDTIVLTEDYYSALKVRWAMGTRANAIALLGTSAADSLAVRLLGKHVVLMLDGDAAGRLGSDRVQRRLWGLGVSCRTVYVPDGLDPKDMQRKQIQEVLLG